MQANSDGLNEICYLRAGIIATTGAFSGGTFGNHQWRGRTGNFEMESILYCGDTELSGAASYLAGLMTHWGWTFDYLPSNVPMTAKQLQKPYSLLILSDFPATQFGRDCQQLALQKIKDGCGLLMIGGWESFHGMGGDWDGTLLSTALPVEIQSHDDRLQFDQSAWLSPTVDHPITAGLPWSRRPPAIGGLNRVKARQGAITLLNAHCFEVATNELSIRSASDSPVWSFRSHRMEPALVVGQHGLGRTSAFMSDVAPHWVGGLVDWGNPRVTAAAKGGASVEVGGHYAQFWKQLLEWTAASS